MSKEVTFVACLALIPHAIEPHWDNVWAPRLAGFPINIVYAARIESVGFAHATYVFDPTAFVEGEQSRQMQYSPEVDSDFSVPDQRVGTRGRLEGSSVPFVWTKLLQTVDRVGADGCDICPACQTTFSPREELQYALALKSDARIERRSSLRQFQPEPGDGCQIDRIDEATP
jgi:hypothetical protein